MSKSFIDLLNEEGLSLKISPVEPWMNKKYNIPPFCKLPKLTKVFYESSRMLKREIADINEQMIRKDERTKANNYHRLDHLDERLTVLLFKTKFETREFVLNKIHEGLIDCSNTKGNSEPEYDKCIESMYQKVDEGEQEVRDIFLKNTELAKNIF